MLGQDNNVKRLVLKSGMSITSHRRTSIPFYVVGVAVESYG